jgi:hypothetical protein
MLLIQNVVPDRAIDLQTFTAVSDKASGADVPEVGADKVDLELSGDVADVDLLTQEVVVLDCEVLERRDALLDLLEFVAEVTPCNRVESLHLFACSGQWTHVVAAYLDSVQVCDGMYEKE